MDVVQEMLHQLKGVCEIESERDKYTKIIIRLPITLSMFNGTIVVSGKQSFVLPNSDFTAIVNLQEDAIVRRSADERIVRHNNRVLKVIELEEALQQKRFDEKVIEEKNNDRSKTVAIVTEHQDQSFAVLVDQLVAQERIVLKKLGSEIEEITGVAGGTILGDGNVALVLDLSEILQTFTTAA